MKVLHYFPFKITKEQWLFSDIILLMQVCVSFGCNRCRQSSPKKWGFVKTCSATPLSIPLWQQALYWGSSPRGSEVLEWRGRLQRGCWSVWSEESRGSEGSQARWSRRPPADPEGQRNSGRRPFHSQLFQQSKKNNNKKLDCNQLWPEKKLLVLYHSP